jgi:hypothetical protein
VHYKVGLEATTFDVLIADHFRDLPVERLAAYIASRSVEVDAAREAIGVEGPVVPTNGVLIVAPLAGVKGWVIEMDPRITHDVTSRSRRSRS